MDNTLTDKIYSFIEEQLFVSRRTAGQLKFLDKEEPQTKPNKDKDSVINLDAFAVFRDETRANSGTTAAQNGVSYLVVITSDSYAEDMNTVLFNHTFIPKQITITESQGSGEHTGTYTNYNITNISGKVVVFGMRAESDAQVFSVFIFPHYGSSIIQSLPKGNYAKKETLGSNNNSDSEGSASAKQILDVTYDAVYNKIRSDAKRLGEKRTSSTVGKQLFVDCDSVKDVKMYGFLSGFSVQTPGQKDQPGDSVALSNIKLLVDKAGKFAEDTHQLENQLSKSSEAKGEGHRLVPTLVVKAGADLCSDGKKHNVKLKVTITDVVFSSEIRISNEYLDFALQPVHNHPKGKATNIKIECFQGETPDGTKSKGTRVTQVSIGGVKK